MGASAAAKILQKPNNCMNVLRKSYTVSKTGNPVDVSVVNQADVIARINN